MIKRIINEMAKYVNFADRGHRNCIRTEGGKKHRDKMVEICRALEDEGMEFICRARFGNSFYGKKYSGCCDIIVLSRKIIIEVMDSETDEYFNKKLEKYPPLNILKVRVDEEFDIRDVQ